MRLILFHGAPAVGKLTVARALSDLTGVPLVDNHLTIDLARNVFSFSAPGFWDLVHDVRVATLRGAARADVKVLITTAAYSHPDDLPLLEDYERAVGEFGGQVDYVHLSCSEQTLRHRVVAPDRVKRGKLSTVDGLARYLAGNNFVPVPRAACLSYSTEAAQPAEIAREVAGQFEMPMPLETAPIKRPTED
ncbi:hypothetical protein [uncultured Tateyamaria sp.]|uniref:hypothetical protein n=1 Tax=uncultured Tateyamaria sp. TaxID=455651 RepID=UPI00261E3F42|nr:hypothetical protein [uncultured Tateyamaria sp.]